MASRIGNPWERLAVGLELVGEKVELLKLLAKHPEAAGAVGDLHLETSEWQQAIAFYDQLITAETTDAELLRKRAQAHVALEEWELAKADWLRVVDLKPAYLEQAFDTFRKAERWKEAAELGLKFIEQRPDEPLPWLTVAPVLVLAGDNAGYAAFCDRAVGQFRDTQAPLDAERISKVALLKANAIDLGRLPAMPFIDSLEDGTAPDSARARFWCTRALLAYRGGDPESAVKYVARSEELDPLKATHALNLTVIALAQHQLGNRSDASSALDEASRVIGALHQDIANGSMTDRLIGEILYREAKAQMIGKGQRERTDST